MSCPMRSFVCAGHQQASRAIELIEKTIIEKAFSLGLVQPQKPEFRSGKKVAVVGSGPAGLAAASQLNKAGHTVIVFERSDRIGGLLRYGIPDFKMEKHIIDRRLEIMEAEGITFKTGVNIGIDLPFYTLINEVDAVVLCGGSTLPRDLNIKGRDLKGVHFAMDFLSQQNKRVAGDTIPEDISISAEGKHVIVIGGGDTGSDCVGTSNRHKAKSVTQIELLAKPPATRSEGDPWPKYPMVLRTSTSHEEGVDRQWSILTKEFISDGNGNVQALRIVDIQWEIGYTGKPEFKEIEGSERDLPCDLALLAIGFVHGETEDIRSKVDIEMDTRGNVNTKNYQTNIENVFAAGDMRRGQSLVVWAITEGREAARAVDEYLMGESMLEARDASHMDVTH
jgi:glutamate synthase (NADPH/NADH) small chain